MLCAMVAAFQGVSADGKKSGESRCHSSRSSCFKKAQLGVKVSKPSKAIYAQLPLLSKGCGFILDAVVPEGSAERSGLQAMDVMWKLEDQILINEGQLAVLLTMHHPGDVVKVQYFRAGVLQETLVTLNEEGKNSDIAMNNAEELPFLNEPDPGMRVISYENRSVCINDENGMAVLKYKNEKPWLYIESKAEKVIFNNYLSDPSAQSLIPARWKAKLPMLQRSLDQSSAMRKLPRVRRVPTPQEQLVDQSGAE